MHSALLTHLCQSLLSAQSHTNSRWAIVKRTKSERTITEKPTRRQRAVKHTKHLHTQTTDKTLTHICHFTSESESHVKQQQDEAAAGVWSLRPISLSSACEETSPGADASSRSCVSQSVLSLWGDVSWWWCFFTFLCLSVCPQPVRRRLLVLMLLHVPVSLSLSSACEETSPGSFWSSGPVFWPQTPTEQSSGESSSLSLRFTRASYFCCRYRCTFHLGYNHQ